MGIASIIGSGINGNLTRTGAPTTNSNLSGISLLLLEVELMETLLDHSLLGIGERSLLLLEVELMETYINLLTTG